MIKLFIFYITYFFIFCLLIKGLLEVKNFNQSLGWLIKENKKYNKIIQDRKTLPFFFVLLPVLREQKVLEKTINNLLKLNYPQDKYQIIVITSQKEIFEKNKNKTHVKEIHSALINGISVSKFVEFFLGVFDENKLREIHQKYNKVKQLGVYEELVKEFDEYPTTIDLAKRIEFEINRNFKKDIIKVIHYPFENGVMVHQINFAVKKLLDIGDIDEKYMVLYNADSNPHRDSLKKAVNILYKNKNKEFVIQQSSFFVKNFESLGKEIKSYILKAGGIFQTQWTLSHEIPRIKKQMLSIDNRNKINSKIGLFFRTKLSHCVGHGLIIKLSLLKNLGFFSTKTMNEDLPFGFNLCSKRISIISLPLIELADTPETIKGIINQKKIWFWSYLDYFKCRKMALADGDEKIVVNKLTIQGLWNGINWFAGSFLYIWLLTIGLIYKEKLFLIIIIIFLILFHFYPTIKIIKNIKYFFDKPIQLHSFDIILTSLAGLFILFTDSLGPWLCVKDKIKFLITKKMPYKQKTER